MKINTITCHDVYNHGASLQAYALQHYLQSEGHDVKIIHYKPDYLSRHFNLWMVANPIFDKPIVKQLYLLAKLPGRLCSLKRKASFDAFTAKYLHLSRRYQSYEDLRSDAPQADAYIAGSDQIWNTTFRNGTDAAFYLDFGPQEVLRLSYAASFATDALAEGTEKFVKTHLANFNSISVRESSGVKLLNSLGFDGTQVVDPVFLLTAKQWSQIESHEGEDEDYVLVYDFMNDPHIRAVAQRLAHHYDCKVVSIGGRKLNYAQKCYRNEGPSSFVSLIKNARCVVSNSFHGTAFSMIFGRDFFVVNRKDGLNSRMRDLLSHFGLIHRLVDSSASDATLLSSIHYESVVPILAQDIEFSKRWLANNLKSKNK